MSENRKSQVMPWEDRESLYENPLFSQVERMEAEIAELRSVVSSQSPVPIPEQVAPSYWNSQRKMIERAIVGLRDGWATRKDADDELALLTPTTSTVSASGALVVPDDVRNQVLEEAAIAAEMANRVGYEWVRDSLWDNIIKRVPATIRALKRTAAQAATDKSED